MRSLPPLLLALFTLSFAAIAAAQPPPPLQPLAPPPIPAGNPQSAAKINLGKALFWEEQMSSTRTVACGTCHISGAGSSDPRSLSAEAASTHPGPDLVFGTADDIVGSPGVPLSLASGAYEWSADFGFANQVTGRRSKSAVDAAYSPLLFWDGRATAEFLDPLTGAVVLPAGGALESQAAGPPVSSVEMAHSGRDWSDVASRIESAQPLVLSPLVPPALAEWIDGRAYSDLFAEAFGTSVVTPARIAMAIASYERTLFSNRTPFDSVLAGTATLTPLENQGRGLFNTLSCNNCHAGNRFTDEIFHYIGVRPVNEDLGRFEFTGAPIDRGAFRTPGLRNVAERAPYFHNGQFATLEDVIDFYDRGGDFNAPNKSPLIVPLNLTAQQKAALAAFLRRPLTDARVASESAPFDRPVLYSESSRVPQLFGTGAAGAGGIVPSVVAIEPPLAGNPAFTVGVYSGLGGAEALLVIDSVDPGAGPSIPSSPSFASISVTLSGAGAGDGVSSVTLAIPDAPDLVGDEFFGRWFVFDPAAPGGVAASAGFSFTIFGTGSGAATSVTPVVAQAFRLHPNSPNPFRPETSIRYEMFEGAPVQLAIYDAAGRAVRRLVEASHQPAGEYRVTWDGRDDFGSEAAAGVYFYRLAAGATTETRRAVLLR
ncbi:MAG: cytochrome c peroxidase [bacterium]